MEGQDVESQEDAKLNKRPSDISIENMEKLTPKRLKAYRNKLLDYRRTIDQSSSMETSWVKNKISQVQKVISVK